MENSRMRIQNVWIQNFKNVEYGHLNFENNRKSYKASILGLYGQNGSGKTALIDALSILKLVLSGRPVPLYYGNSIHVGSEYSTFKFQFSLINDQKPAINCNIFYEFSLKKGINSQNETNIESDEPSYRSVLFNEKLSYSYERADEKLRLSTLIDTSLGEIFSPKAKFEVLVGKEKSTAMDLLVEKKLASITSRSFIFSKELLNTIRKQYQAQSQNQELSRHVFVLENMVNYGNYDLFVINTSDSGLISLDALPLTFQYTKNNQQFLGQIAVSLNGPAIIPDNMLNIVKDVCEDMNIVLAKIVPGLTIGVKDLGQQMTKTGAVSRRIQLMSYKNRKEIPLQFESQGIKKIVSILQLLIVVYNKSSITVAIDELDSGIFEYLLGELLNIISEKGKGQLIFTSHNLRPLETIDRGFIAFTTTNPQNRYIRFNHVKDNHNLRDFYFRDIVLGEQSEEVYEPTNNYEIALAFREAGDTIES